MSGFNPYSIDTWEKLQEEGKSLFDLLEEHPPSTFDEAERRKNVNQAQGKDTVSHHKEGGDTQGAMDDNKDTPSSLGLHRIDNERALAGEYPSKPWVIEGFLPEQGLALWQGLPAGRKSLLALYLSVCVASGAEFAGQETKRSNIIILSYEDEAPVLADRIKRLRESIKLSDLQVEYLKECLNVYDCVGQFSTLVNIADKTPQITPVIQDFIQAQLAKDMPNIIIIDTASRALLGINENDNTEMGLVVHALEEFVRKHNLCLMLIHHLGKSSSEHGLYRGRGASVLPASARAIISLDAITREDSDGYIADKYQDDTVIRIRVDKLSHSRPLKNLYFRHTPSGFLYYIEINKKESFINIIAEAVCECTKQGQSYFTLDELMEKKNFKSALKRIGIPLREKGKTRELLDEAVKQKLIGVEVDGEPGKRGPKPKKYGPIRGI